MNDQWQAWLQSRGMSRSADGQTHFTRPEDETRRAAEQDVIVDLSAWSLIAARGADAEVFLQGQLTNDTRNLAGATRLAGYCTAQGRLLALFRLFMHGDAIILQIPAPLAEATIKRLRMFVLRSKVTLSLDDDRVAFGIAGFHAEAYVREFVGAAPTVGACLNSNDVSALRLPGTTPRFQIVAPMAQACELWQRAEQLGARAAATAAWRWLDIVNGLPTVLPPTVETFVPQMLNLDVLDGINFKKGCYPGQEIVARMHFLGRLKQRMYRARLAEEAKAGDPVYSANFGEQAAGSIVDAQPSPEGGWDVLTVVQISSAESGEVHVGRADGPLLQMLPLPYALPSASN